MMNRRNPFLKYVDDFEKEAELFLINYGYKDLIDNPAPIPIRDIIENKMGLEIIDNEFLSPDASVQGITAFYSGIVQIFDWYELDYVGYAVKEPTIFVDSSYTSEGYINRILAHEAYHWYKHRSYFMYEANKKLSDEFAIRCLKKSNLDKDTDIWTDQQIMEYQARKIAPLLLLPKKSVINRVRELTCKTTFEFSSEDVDVEQLINDLSSFYKVTPYTMKSRLNQLGYKIDEYVYENDPQISYVKESNYKNFEQSKNINLLEAFELYQSNAQFRDCINTGVFKFRNNAIYFKYDIDNDSINYLVFQTKLKPNTTMNSTELMFRQNQTYTAKKVFGNQPQNIEALDKARQLQDKFMKEHQRKAKNKKTANQTMWQHMKDANWDVSTFQDKTLLNPMDFTRIQREHKFGLRAYAAMAVGLGLSLSEFTEIINLAGMTLIQGNTEHDAYSFILSSMNGEDIDTCNDFLENIEVDTLGSKTRATWGDNQFK